MNQNGRRRFVLLVAGLGLSLLTSTAFGQASNKPATTEEIAKLFDQWNAALQTGNAEEVAKLYAPDGVLIPTLSNKVRTNREEITDYFEHFLKYKPVGKIDEQHIRILGDVAINSGTYTFTLMEDGKPKEVHARYTFVYQKKGDRWLIVEHHSSMSPQKSPKP